MCEHVSTLVYSNIRVFQLNFVVPIFMRQSVCGIQQNQIFQHIKSQVIRICMRIHTHIHVNISECLWSHLANCRSVVMHKICTLLWSIELVRKYTSSFVIEPIKNSTTLILLVKQFSIEFLIWFVLKRTYENLRLQNKDLQYFKLSLIYYFTQMTIIQNTKGAIVPVYSSLL